MDKSDANKAAMDEINTQGETPIIVRQLKYLNNIFEQDHHWIRFGTNGLPEWPSRQGDR